MDNVKNLSLLADFYEFSMINGYFETEYAKKIAYFDVFFRKIPDNAGFAIFAGLEQFIEYIKNLRFDDDDIEYLRGKRIFSEKFLNYLKNFKFTCDVWAVPEGTPIFPGEPIVTVRGPVMEAQLIETMLLLTINHQSLIVTKANRIVRAACGKDVIDFGSRRAHGTDAAIYGARAAYIGGVSATSCTIVGKMMGIPVLGTMAHSWVQMFDNEYEAFRQYSKKYPENCVLLVDTYNVLKSGIPNAIKVFNEILRPKGFRPKGIRLDSGDLAYLARKARNMLDNAGYKDCKIVVSNSLDEYLIRDINLQCSEIDYFGVGERLITSRSEPVFGGVYKLVALEEKGKIIPKIKLSENTGKISNPGVKELWRLFGEDSNKAIADLITLKDEKVNECIEYELFDPINTWKRKTVSNFLAKKIKVKIFDRGKLIYKCPKLNDIRKYTIEQIYTLWEEVLRFENPHKYYIDLSKKLWNFKNEIIKNIIK